MDFTQLDEQLSVINSHYPNINAGGCGKFALLLANKLKKEGLNSRFVLFSNIEEKCIKTRQKVLTTVINNGEFKDLENNSTNFVVAHVMVFCQGYYMDCTGVYKRKPSRWSRYKLAGFLTENTLIKWCEGNGWNEMFNTANLFGISKELNKLKLN